MRTFTFPFVVLAEAGLVFFYLGFEFAESLLAADAGMGAGCRGVQCARWEGQIQGAGVFFFAGIFRENAVQLNEIRGIGLQKFFQFFYVFGELHFHGFVRLDVLVAYGNFHERTCRVIYARRARRRIHTCTAHGARIAAEIAHRNHIRLPSVGCVDTASRVPLLCRSRRILSHHL